MNNTGNQPAKRSRGGAVKVAPPGFYTAKEAQKKLGLNASTFGYYVRTGRIDKTIPPLKKEGFYHKKGIDMLASELALFLHTTREEVPPTETRFAQSLDDAKGIVHVLETLGWPTTVPEQRTEWYQVNPFIDYIALLNNDIAGYIHAVPLKPGTLADMMAGRKRSWNIAPQDILPYRQHTTADLYTGIATRSDIALKPRRYVGFRLISGFFSFLEELAEKQIFIRRLYAVSAEEDGRSLSKSIGFVQQPTQEGDLFKNARFMMDLETSNFHFAKVYREVAERSRVTQ